MYEQIEKLHYCKKCGMVCSNEDDYCSNCIIDEIYEATHRDIVVFSLKRGKKK